MSRMRLQSKHEQAFVRLGTLRDMSVVAKKMSMARSAIQEIGRIENILSARRNDTRLRAGLQDIANLALVVKQETREAISILRSVKMAVEAYIRDLKRVLAD